MTFLTAAAPLWRTIEQPLPLQVLVVAGGLALIAWELWWFLGRHGSSVAAHEGERGVQEITITVDGGYAPSRIRVQAGRPVRLAFHRIDPSGCVAQVIFPDFHKTLDLAPQCHHQHRAAAQRSGHLPLPLRHEHGAGGDGGQELISRVPIMPSSS
jgi:hypothetical protein